MFWSSRDGSPQQNRQPDKSPEKYRASSDQRQCDADGSSVTERFQDNSIAAFVNAYPAGNEAKSEIYDLGQWFDDKGGRQVRFEAEHSQS